MKKISRKLIALVLSFSMLLSLGAMTFAAEPTLPDAQVTESGSTRTAITSDGVNTYESTYEYETGVLTFRAINISTGNITQSFTVNTSQIAQPMYSADQDTFAGYRYTVVGKSPYDEWTLSRPQSASRSFVDTYYFKLFYTPHNEKYLDTFEAAVETLDDSEKAAIVAYGLSFTVSFIAGVVAGAAAGPLGIAALEAIAASILPAGTAAMAMIKVGTDMNACWNAIEKAYKYGEGVHV